MTHGMITSNNKPDWEMLRENERNNLSELMGEAGSNYRKPSRFFLTSVKTHPSTVIIGHFKKTVIG